MIKNLIIVLFTFSVFATNAHANDISLDFSNTKTEPLCKKPIDLSNQIGPIKDQGNLGFCYAHAATTLVEQHHCKLKLPTCNKIRKDGLSVIDGVVRHGVFVPADHTGVKNEKNSGTYMNSSYIAEGGWPADFLEVANNGGFCQESKVPLFVKQSDDYSPAAVINELGSFYHSYRGVQDMAEACEVARFYARSVLEASGTDPVYGAGLGEITKFASEMVTLMYKYNYENFLDSILLPDECKKNRLKTPQFKINESNYYSFPDFIKKRLMEHDALTQLKKGNAVAVAIYNASWELDPTDPGYERALNSSAPHAVVVAGCKRVNGKTFVKVINSYGQVWQDKFDGGWIDADRFFAQVFKLNWIE